MVRLWDGGVSPVMVESNMVNILVAESPTRCNVLQVYNRSIVGEYHHTVRALSSLVDFGFLLFPWPLVELHGAANLDCPELTATVPSGVLHPLVVPLLAIPDKHLDPRQHLLQVLDVAAHIKDFFLEVSEQHPAQPGA